MDLSNLQFKVHHKPGTAMGHVDGPSRLETGQVNSLRMADLLNPVEPVDVAPDLVGEPFEPLVSTSPVKSLKFRETMPPKRKKKLRPQMKGLCLPWTNSVWMWNNPFVRARVVRMAPRYVVTDGLLRRYVNLPARVGPARTLAVPVVPPSYVATILHYCHADLLSSHLGLTKTTEKVKRLAYWPGWHKDVVKYVKECNKCVRGVRVLC
ncbi:hypothetical protein PC129_g24085 [Phytophthora cactorum]|uniref:Integrase zinc-binding domain-containing protein n=1 Tax=Phytophthora cactorum TaxID=29920 RepID=A0A8T1EX40_9STRA|nr:hypothetical protein PC114_g25927 [Phytophthora cactorum]KAG2956553.1 hypothetical protein PC118_g24414 [Phytophthora cactorum]KAG3199547.1 hypothetical protein PC129_g24085 [Phytophthora cactorum]